MQPAIEVSGLGKSFGGQSVLVGLDFRSPPARCSPCSARTAPARPRRSTSSRPWCSPTRARATVAGFDVVRDADPVQAADQPHRPVGGGRRRAHRRREPRDARAAVRARHDRGEGSRDASCSSASTSAMPRRAGLHLLRRHAPRLDLALSFVVTPTVLFLDEPTTGLDTRSRRELWDVIRRLADAGTTVLPHHAVPRGGRSARRPDRGARRRPHRRHRNARRAEGAARRRDRRAARRTRRAAARGARPTAPSRACAERSMCSTSRAPKASSTLRRPSLDDVFLALTTPASTRRQDPPGAVA